MEALSIIPGRAGSLQLGQVEEPPAGQVSVLVRTLAVGVCGTDRELIGGEYGAAPEGKERLVLGHESLGRVVQAPEDEWDMCRRAARWSPARAPWA